MTNILYLLKPIRPIPDSWPYYDILLGIVVRAPSPEAARVIAGKNAGDEWQYSARWAWEEETGEDPGCLDLYGNPWLDEELTTCEPLTNDGPVGLVLQDFRLG